VTIFLIYSIILRETYLFYSFVSVCITTKWITKYFTIWTVLIQSEQSFYNLNSPFTIRTVSPFTIWTVLLTIWTVLLQSEQSPKFNRKIIDAEVKLTYITHKYMTWSMFFDKDIRWYTCFSWFISSILKWCGNGRDIKMRVKCRHLHINKERRVLIWKSIHNILIENMSFGAYMYY